MLLLSKRQLMLVGTTVYVVPARRDPAQTNVSLPRVESRFRDLYFKPCGKGIKYERPSKITAVKVFPKYILMYHPFRIQAVTHCDFCPN